MDDLQKRIEILEISHSRLERRVFNQRLLIVALIFATLVFLSVSSLRPRNEVGGTPRTNEIAVFDGSGLKRSAIEAASDNPDAVVQSFWDKTGSRRIDLGVTSGTLPCLRFIDPVERLSLGLSNDRYGIEMKNERQQRLIALELFHNDKSKFEMRSAEGGGIYMEVDTKGDPSLKLLDNSGRVVWQAP
jgi:hypothetical protein